VKVDIVSLGYVGIQLAVDLQAVFRAAALEDKTLSYWSL